MMTLAEKPSSAVPSSSGGTEPEEITVDLVVVGSGGGGLVAALRAAAAGMTPLLVEKTEFLGGSTAMSGGQVWIPANHFLAEAGIDDDLDKALEYLQSVVGEDGPATSRARKQAFLRGALEMLEFLEAEGLQFTYSPSPDDYPDEVGGQPRGRSLEAKLLYKSALAGWESWLRPGGSYPVTLYTHESLVAGLAARRPAAAAGMARIVARTIAGKVRRDKQLTMGQALAGRLLLALQRRGVWTWRNTPMHDLVVEGGRVVGIHATHERRPVTIRGRHGVVLSAGGFAHNAELRAKHQAPPINGQWSAASPGDTGDPVRAAMAIGAATANLDEAIWLPAPVLNGQPILGLLERSLPHSIIVDSSAQRYMNESGPYMECGQRMLARHREVPAVPSWLIIDSRHRRRYPFGLAAPGITPREWIKSGFMKKAKTLEDLATQCGLDPAALRDTITRFNRMAEQGRDEDFGRGDTSYDRWWSDPTHKPNGSLGTIEKAPFYAVEQVVSDVSTVGGIVTDEHARALREDGSVIEGLYASGCSSASVHGRTYPAPGASVANTMVFGDLAARHAIAQHAAITR